MIRVTAIAHHRNSSAGTGFYVALFQRGRGKSIERFVATVFPERRAIAILRVDLLVAGNVRFGENSWDGPEFEDAIRQAILNREVQADGALSDEERSVLRYGEHTCVPCTRGRGLIPAGETCVVCRRRVVDATRKA